jgi:methylated-DNA-[protein]-cysteine S-methyltransferase
MNELEPIRTLDVDAASRRAAEGLAQRAAASGLIDVPYAFVPSPLGRLLVAGTRRGLVRLAYPNETPDDVLDELARELSPRVLESPAMLDEVRRELEEYFAGRRRQFEAAVDFSLSSGFYRRVLRATSRIPFGSVSTYRDVAARAGNRAAARAAGNALGCSTRAAGWAATPVAWIVRRPCSVWRASCSVDG